MDDDWKWRIRTESRGWGKATAMAKTEAEWDERGLHWHRVGPAGLNEGHNCPPECTDGKPAAPPAPNWYEALYDAPGYSELVRRHLARQATIQDLFLLHAVLRTGTFWIQWAWRAGYRGPLRGRAMQP